MSEYIHLKIRYLYSNWISIEKYFSNHYMDDNLYRLLFIKIGTFLLFLCPHKKISMTQSPSN